MSNLSDLEATLYDRLGFTSTPATVVTTRLRRFINETHRQILGTKGCARLRRNVVPFFPVISTPFSVLPQPAVNIITIQDRVNNWILDPIELADLRALDPGLVQTGPYPTRYVIMNYSAGAAVSPRDIEPGGVELFVVSDSAADVSATKTAAIEGLIAGDVLGAYYGKATAGLNGVTPVTFGAATNWLYITKFYLTPTGGANPVPTATGNISLQMGDLTEVSRISAGRQSARFTLIQLHPVPTTAITLYADVELHIEDMANLGDESYLPEDYDWLLITGAMMKELKRKKDYPGYGIEKKTFEDGVEDLKGFIRRRSGVAMGMRRRRDGAPMSQLGPWYPAGT